MQETPFSALDLAGRFRDRDPVVDRASSLFDVVELPCSELVLSARGRVETFAAFRAPLHAIEHQTVISLADLTLHREALVNHLRARRGGNLDRAVAEPASGLTGSRPAGSRPTGSWPRPTPAGGVIPAARSGRGSWARRSAWPGRPGDG